VSGDALLYAIALALPPLLGVATVRFLRRRAGAPASPAMLVAGNALVLALILSVLFLGFETHYRFVRDVTDGDALTKGSARWFERHWRTNALGFRDDVDYAFQRDGHRRRVTFFGDSFTAGHGVAVSDRFLNRVRAARPEWEVHGIAAPGASTELELVALNRLLERGYDLDTVVLVYCFNDLDPFVPELSRFYESVTREPPLPLRPLVDHSYFANALFYYWKVSRTASDAGGLDYFSMIEQAYSGEAWEREKQALREFQRAVEAGGGQLLAVTFPMLLRLGRGQEEHHPMHAKLAEFWQARGVPHLDLLPVLAPKRGPELVVSGYDDHPSPTAHALAAEALLPFLHTHARPPTPER
jgi:hypothetical protein